MEMLRTTIQSYVNAINPSLDDAPNIKSLFGNDIPNLSERIDCFPVRDVERVHDVNLKQMAERNLADKIKQKSARYKKRKTPPAPSSLPPEAHIVWSPQQAAIIMAVSRFLDSFVDWKNGNASKPKPLNMLLFGGPGAIYNCQCYINYPFDLR